MSGSEIDTETHRSLLSELSLTASKASPSYARRREIEKRDRSLFLLRLSRCSPVPSILRPPPLLVFTLRPALHSHPSSISAWGLGRFIQTHRPSQGLSDFIRIELALDLDFSAWRTRTFCYGI